MAVAAVEDLLPDAPSYFEILTAAALRWFGDVAVDVAVVEVGLGGTGDATNVVDADVAVVTNVSIDHVEYIGPTLADIAAEKAGIVEPTSALVLGETDPALVPYFLARDPASVARARRRLRRAREPARDRWPGRSTCTRRTRRTTTCSSRCTARTRPTTPRSRSPRRSRSSDARSIPSSSPTRSRSVRTPGRLEVVGHQPLVLLDGVKNVAGAHALRAALADEFADSPRTLVVGLDAREGTARDARGARRARRGATRVLPSRQPAWPRPARRRRRGLRPRRRARRSST